MLSNETIKYLSQYGDKWKCSACNHYSASLIDYPIGQVHAKICFECYKDLEEVNNIADIASLEKITK